MRQAPANSKSSAPALDRGIDVVELLASSRGPVSFSDILSSLNIPKASLVRILNTLCKRGIVARADQSKHYRLGMKLLYLGNRLQDELRLRAAAWPFMQRLADEVRETVELSIQDRDQLVLIEQIEGPGEVRVYYRVGAAYPYFHAVSVGKVYLAHMDAAKRRNVLERIGLPAVTPWTITDRDKLERELVEVLARGYAIEDQELRRGVRRVAAPIYDHDRRVAGCLSIAAPVFRLGPDDWSRLGLRLAAVTAEISESFGGTLQP
jgi:DNA-binding IclR family transcriptional regulator